MGGPPEPCVTVPRMCLRRSPRRLISLAALAAMALLPPRPASPQTSVSVASTWSATSPAANRWFSHVEALASDEMRGRQTGSAEHRKAADYVAAQFKAAGLAPGMEAGGVEHA